MKASELRELARLYGVQLNYEDAAGKKRIASNESLEAVLRAMKDGPDPRADPVIVAWGGKTPRVEGQIVLENGERFKGGTLPFGYHALKNGRKHVAMIFSAPAKAPEPEGRTWGVFTPLYAFHTDRTWGIGDLSDMRALQDWVESLGGDVVGTLPLNAIFAEQDPSPYSPVSRLYWNEMYLDVRRLPEYRGDSLDPLPLTDRVDYRQVMAAKRKVLVEMSRRFFENPDPGFSAFAAEANDYALFRSRMEATAGVWREWADEDEFSFDAARYHLYVQYRMQQQLGELKGLYLDFPLGVHPNGYDAWRFDEQFANGVSVGAPPDLFFTKGQNWGFPPLHPIAVRAHHHSYFRECVRRQLEHASMLRIDHVMGLHRLFWIPEGMEAKDGVYVRYPADELYAVLTIEAHRAHAVVVGEDLGTVPKYVPQMMEKRGIHRMFVVQYDPKGKPPVDSVASINTHDMPTFSGYWNGKDIDDRIDQGLLDEAGANDERKHRESTRRRLVKFLKESSDDTRTVLESLLQFLGTSEAEIVLVNLEDLWLEEQPQNVPGVPERSWCQRLRMSLQEMQNDAAVTDSLRAVDRARRKKNGDETQKKRRR